MHAPASSQYLLELYAVEDIGLVPIIEKPFFARITDAFFFHPTNSKKDLLFISTDEGKYCFLSFNSDLCSFQTLHSGSLYDRSGRISDVGTLTVVDPTSTIISQFRYHGRLECLVNLKSVQHKTSPPSALTLSMDDLTIIDLQYLYVSEDFSEYPVFALIVQDTKSSRSLKLFQVSIEQRQILPISYEYAVDNDALILIPVELPIGGIIVVSSSSLKQNERLSHAQHLLQQKYFVLRGLTKQEFFLEINTLTGLDLVYLGETSPASVMRYIDNGYVYIGSHTADSQIVLIHQDPIFISDSGTESFVEVKEVLMNLAPLLDSTVVDLDKQDQGQLITSSNADRNGCLRIIRNGIGIVDIAELDVSGLMKVFAIRSGFHAEFDDTLLLSFLSETRIFRVIDDLEEIGEDSHWEISESTLFAGTMMDFIVQITETQIIMLNTFSRERIGEWKPKFDHTDPTSEN
ncbi:DNA damage-binding protein 1a, partial [Nowakowskiella sp. JEL0078]